MLARAARLKPKSAPVVVHWTWIRSLSSKDVRSKFISYFEEHSHLYYPSSSVIPKKGDGTYFTNAGMNQFKPLFLSQAEPGSKLWGLKRAVNSQKCIRVGGKHNDLEDVGHDLTHHTFFEMLGNWSFGDYFKREACRMAYELLTDHFDIPKDRLYFTYFGGDETMGLSADEECLDIWASLGIPRDRILPFGARDNFWDMGVTGPCGPCTEIHFDHIGGRNAGSEVNSGSPNVVEIWNLVFMQYNRLIDQSLTPLPNRHVDTGMGLERMVAVTNGSADNYQTDLFRPLFEIIQKTTKCQPYQGLLTTEDTALRMLADHSRMFTVAISDGLLPSNSNLGHKVRIILHKCIQLCRRHFKTDAQLLLPAMVKGVVTTLEEAYPELSQNQGKVIDVVMSAVGHYDTTMEQAIRSFHKMMAKVAPTNFLSGDVISALEKGHFGNAIAIEMVADIAESYGLMLDMEGYHKICQEESRPSPSSSPSSFTLTPAEDLVKLLIEQEKPATDDTFKYCFHSNGGVYDFSSMTSTISPCSIQGINGSEGQATQSLDEGQVGEVVLDKTCFYAEAGGQEADKGFLYSQTGTFEVDSVQSHRGYIIHSGHVRNGHLLIGQSVNPELSSAERVGNMRNHTATHLLNATLRKVLPSSQQEGSNINSHRFTFDFLALSEVDDIQYLETRVKELIEESHPVTCTEKSFVEAKQDSKIRWNQNEDYPDQVRVVSIGSSPGNMIDISKELCGGTHVHNTADIGDFCITGLSSKSQHVKRITCVTGPQATQAHQNGEILDSICSLLQLLHNFVQGKRKVDEISEMVQSLSIRIQEVKEYLANHIAKSSAYTYMDKIKGESEKVLVILDSLCENLQTLQNDDPKSEACVDVMKHLIDRIHQYQHLELLPKTVRQSSHSCVKDMEHKVQALINTYKAAGLRQTLKQVEMGGYDSDLNLITVDTNMNPRQVLKVITKHPILKPVIVIQDVKPQLHVVLSIPLNHNKHAVKQELAELLEMFQGAKTVKSKVAIQSETRVVLKISGHSDQFEDMKDTVYKWWGNRR